MTQISSNTLTYDQIYVKIKNFFTKEINKYFGTNQDRLEEYNKLVSELYESIGGPSTKLDLFIKGEPPVSDKFNSFSKDVAADFALVAKQLDYLNAKTINAYNLFSQEIESEKKYLERIASKAKVLQMYSQAPAEDIIYVGDSFDNQDQVDITKVAIGLNPLVDNGSFTLPIFNSRPWYPKTITINNSKSNGFLGDNHEVKKSLNADGSESYSYLYKSNKTLSSLSVISDENPLTYFEYEGLNVDKQSNSSVDQNLLSTEEFCYLSNRKVTPTLPDGSFVDWSNFDLSSNLKLSLIFECGSPTLANSLTITPYFGSSNLIKVTSVVATLQDGSLSEVLTSPIYIGSSFAPFNLDIAKSYFYNKATIKFSEVRALKFEVLFEQESYQDIDIFHAYWKPNYQSSNIVESPFNGLSRFNPGALSKDLYELIEYDKYSLVPEITIPNYFKDKENLSKVSRVRLKKRPEVFSGYVISFNAYVGSNTKSKKMYFYNFNLSTAEANDFGWVENLSEIFIDNNSGDLITAFGYAKYTKTAEELADDLVRLKSYLGFDPANLDSTKNTLTVVGPPSFSIRFEEPQIEYVTYSTVTQSLIYSVPITLNYELYKAKRKSIGLRDVSFFYEVYADRAEIVSTPYNFEYSVESLMISSESTIDNLFDDKMLLNYYVSLNDSNWIEISPIQLHSSGTAEILVLNQNIPLAYQIAGVAYLNYPTIPSDVKTVRVKIEMMKDRLSNVTPIVYSYKLIARIKK